MKALVLEKQLELDVREYPVQEQVGPDDVRIQIKSCGICGSDVHYYLKGAIGNFVVRKPMILGHEASGIITEVGSNVTHLKVGDRVCMEPGIPDLHSRETLSGNYNIDPAVRFWATPPINGCCRESVVHPAMLTFKIPPQMSYDEGAMIEPLSIGMEAAKRAQIQPGDTALVTGAGTIGIMTAISALAGGCSCVYLTDIKQKKLDIAASYEGIVAINTKDTDVVQEIMDHTEGLGVQHIFECSGFEGMFPHVFEAAAPGANVVLIGIPGNPVPIDINFLQQRGITIKTIFRYVNEYPASIAQVGSGKIDVKRLISKVYPFEESVKAYEFAAQGREDVVKVMIRLGQ